MKKSDLDKRICDIEPNASNKETYREFLINSYRLIYGNYAIIPDFDGMTEDELNDRIDEMDWILSK